MLASEAVETVRSYLTGSEIDEISVLLSAYTAGSGTLNLQYPKRNIAPGATLTAGLNTFTVVETSTDGATVNVIPSMDGGPDVSVPAGTIVRVKPNFTTWAIYREIQSEIDSMSAASTGLYQSWVVEATSLAFESGIYAIPDRTDGLLPFRLLRSEFLVAGSDSLWVTFTDTEFIKQGNGVRVFSDPPQVAGYRFSLAVPFGQMVDLTTDLTSLGLTNSLAGIAMYGATAMMALGWEGRRVQPVFQGDSRRATEVTPTSNSALAMRFKQAQQQAITEEQTRLIGQWGYRQPQIGGSTAGISRW